jgi:hypothetical protein
VAGLQIICDVLRGFHRHLENACGFIGILLHGGIQEGRLHLNQFRGRLQAMSAFWVSRSVFRRSVMKRALSDMISVQAFARTGFTAIIAATIAGTSALVSTVGFFLLPCSISLLRLRRGARGPDVVR